MKRLEGALHSALRREKVAESAVERLKAEIEHISRLVCLVRKSNDFLFSSTVFIVKNFVL